ncbi:MAG: aminopeptidase P family protein [Clostridia bacterium]|nr:aminopeptidase P family protein [Clostridia bacterium]
MQIIDRIKAFRACMEEENMAAVIVPTADSHASEYLADHFKTRQWLSGFTGSAGTLVVGREEAALFTDGRYFIQAEKQLAGTGITLMRMGTAGVPSVEEYVSGIVKAGESCGVDFSVISSHFAADMSDMLAGREIALRDTGDWFEALWADRPSMPKDPVYLLEEKYTGMGVSEKLGKIREVMAKAGADMHLTNVLDEIAWTLNVRGNDVHCTPVVMSYLLVGKESASWFVDTEKVSEEIQDKLFAQGVYLREYSEIESALEGIEPGTGVMIDGRKLTANLCAALADTNIIQHENPAFRIKAIKNDVELENLRLAHVKDGLAVTRLMYWLKKNAGKTPMDELSVDEKLLALRAQQEHFISPSFDTICAYRANAAMMHYRATEESYAKIEAKDLLLIDSGAQYLEGTTDITRTFAMGEVEQEQKEHFTAVLCGMLNLQNAKFLHGCTGISLDVLARGPMWDMGIDYRCGTGHGVGYLLSVHEGPNAFRWYKSPTRNEDTVLEAGMVTTDEPGIYIEGSHGIRIENELVSRNLELNEYGQFMGFEPITCAPIDLDAVIPEQMTRRQRQWLNAYHAFVLEKLEPLMADEDERAWLRHATRAI